MSDLGRRAVIRNIRHGDPAQGRGRCIYARLCDAETGETIISATLDYILVAVLERGFILVEEKAA